MEKLERGNRRTFTLKKKPKTKPIKYSTEQYNYDQNLSLSPTKYYTHLCAYVHANCLAYRFFDKRIKYVYRLMVFAFFCSLSGIVMAKVKNLIASVQ